MPARGRWLYRTGLVFFISRSLRTVDSFQRVKKGHPLALLNRGEEVKYEKLNFEMG